GKILLRMPRALGVGKERLADVPEANFLVEGEGVDRRVAALPLAAPGSDEERDRFHLGGELRGVHAPDAITRSDTVSFVARPSLAEQLRRALARRSPTSGLASPGRPAA